ncbi:molybdopterin-synthase adenylyltransferase MoeB [Clostridium saccharoperbutylacetonicum]|uniref:molybdopterin-synthase adenylyltransferase MoeB n=1 Tax=Clostridium saccharoperbutylacetonicum TaxID=36745 RepID=UPI0039ED986A
MCMNEEEYLRYSRHLLLKDIGFDGQCKLIESKVVIVGVGGLGSPIAMYLAACGIGTIGIVEFDDVEISNLQRQIIYDTKSIGQSKAQLAARRINDINPNCKAIMHEEPLTKENVLKIFNEYDYVVDATDNLATRYLINDACVLLKKTYVYGSIQEFEGQATVFATDKGPCYRCIFPKHPKHENIPGGLEKGVLGVIPGIIGAIQATEVIKLICNIGMPMIGKMLYYNALEMNFDELSISKDVNCPVCGANRITSLGNYNDIKNLESLNGDIPNMSCKEVELELQNDEDFLFLDVRDGSEYNKTHISDFINIPVNELSTRLSEININSKRKILITSEVENRSSIAARVLRAKGHKEVYILKGGIKEWENKKLCANNDYIGGYI